MTKLLVVLFIGLVFEAVGVIYLNKGVKQAGEIQKISASEILRVVKNGVTNGNILFGILLMAIFFCGLLYLMSQGTVSFVWPLTSLGFVLTTLAARFILHEEVSLVRWSGVFLIMVGAGFITYSEKLLENKTPATAPIPAVSTTRQ
jgi:drug/metabolite transporter (DMT)-like permease